MASREGVGNGDLFAHPSNQGHIQVIFGPMFSGKTTELIRRCKRYLLAKYRCIIVKYAKDTRYTTDSIATHDKETLSAIPAITLQSIRDVLLEHEVIAIDEGQFFPDTVAISEEMANRGKIVIVAALDGDFKREKFGAILDLVPRAESVIKLHAVCMRCFHSAAYTKRISNECEIEVIGGADKYIAVCRACYHLNETSTELGVTVAAGLAHKHGQQQQLATTPIAVPLHERNQA